jgi:hypothetical protein
MMQRRDAVRQDAAADHEHRRRADHRQRLHQQRRGQQQALADRSRERAAPGQQVEPEIVHLDDAGDDAIDADGHQEADPREHRDLRGEGLVGDGAERDDDDFGREHEVGADRPLDLVGFERRQVDRFVAQRGSQLLGVLRFVVFVAASCSQ